MHGAPESQIAAQSDSQIVHAAEARLHRRKIGQSLRGVHMSTIAGVDDRHGGCTGRHERGAFLRVADRHHVHVVGHGFQGVRNGFALGHGSELGAGEADHLAAESEHGGFKAQTRTGAGLIK